MKVEKVFPSTYLKAADLRGEKKNVVIRSCEMHEMVDQEDKKRMMPVVIFQDDEGTLVLNKTNWNTLLGGFGGDDTDEWTGRTITIFPTPVTYKGKTVDGIRISVPVQSEQPQPDRINLDQDVPF